MNPTWPNTTSSPLLEKTQMRRVGPLVLIILLHIGFLYALQNGLTKKTGHTAVPHEVTVTFLTPESPQPPAAIPQPATPKAPPVVKQTPKHTPPPAKPDFKPAPHAITPKPAPVAQTTTPTQTESTAPTPAPAMPAAPVASSAPAAPAAPAIPKTITSGVQYIQKPEPTYPMLSMKMNEQGKVLLRVLINEKGLPEHAEIYKSSGYDRLNETALKGVMQWTFKPYMENGKPVKVFAIIPITFHLD
jgi:protein TonB